MNDVELLLNADQGCVVGDGSRQIQLLVERNHRLYDELKHAQDLIVRIVEADRKPHWQEGESLTEIMSISAAYIRGVQKAEEIIDGLQDEEE